MDVAAKKFTKLGDAEYKGNYLWPMFGSSGAIYFVADRLAEEKNVKFAGPEVMKSTYNIWKISERGGKPTQVTHHTSGNLAFPSISASGKSTEIKINITTDVKENDVELRTVSSEAESFSVSPSGKRAAISTHGEIFTIATDRGEVQRVSETFWREQNPKWSPD